MFNNKDLVRDKAQLVTPCISNSLVKIFLGKFLVTLCSMNQNKLIVTGRLHAHAQKRYGQFRQKVQKSIES
jgi:hypothetical protein